MQKVSKTVVIEYRTWSSILIMDRRVSIYPKIFNDKSNTTLYWNCKQQTVEMILGAFHVCECGE